MRKSTKGSQEENKDRAAILKGDRCAEKRQGKGGYGKMMGEKRQASVVKDRKKRTKSQATKSEGKVKQT